ncbi:hypothetical protein, partial [Caulobacter sp. 17J65-9]|uniref:hypothetical protein n=1 Tax=Caulobacter sp. 17J65-9 TaxID=2709382 RepID=UPI0013C6A773
MDGPAFDVTELPPKRGAPPKFRRNRVATIATLCVLGFAAGMGVQWGMLRRGPPSAPPASSTPKRALVPTAPRKHNAMTVGSDAPAQTAVAPVETAAVGAPSPTTPLAATPATQAGSTPLPYAPSVGLSRDALDYGRRAEA